MVYKATLPFNVPAQILKAEYEKVNGVKKKVFKDGDIIYISAKSYGGTERTINDTIMIEDTINVETVYRPDITSIDGIRLLDDNSEWEIINHPEDIERRHALLKFKVKRMVGGA